MAGSEQDNSSASRSTTTSTSSPSSRSLFHFNSSFEIYNIPLLALVFVLLVFGAKAENIVFTVVAFAWPWALTNKALAEKIQQKKLRLSVLGLIFRGYHYLLTFSFFQRSSGTMLARNLGPWLFILLIILLAQEGNFLYAILGTLSFEGFKVLVDRGSPNQAAAKQNFSPKE